MAQRISASAVVGASPQRVYSIIADYRHGHPRILPKPPFVSLEVEQGGYGEGTVILVRMRVLGLLQAFRAVVAEPEPGRVLVEKNDTGYVTTFTVEPRSDGRESLVTIETDTSGRSGAMRAFESRVVSRLMRPVLVRELEQLAAVAAEPGGVEGASIRPVAAADSAVRNEPAA